MALVTYDMRQVAFGLVAQSTWGTAELASVNYNLANEGMQLDHGLITYDPDLQVLDRDLAQGTLNQVGGDAVYSTSGAMPKFSLSGMVAKHDELDMLLYAIAQNVSEGATTPFAKTYTFNKTANPDFTTSAGYFLTAGLDAPVASQDVIIGDVICESLKLSVAPGGYLMVDASMAGRGYPSEASTFSGTWARSTDSFWKFESIARATYNSVDINPVGPIEFEFKYELIPVGTDSGDFATIHLGKRIMTYRFVANYSSLFATLVSDKSAHTQRTLRVGWGNATAGTDDGDLDITGNVEVRDVKIVDETVLGIEVTGNFVAATAAADPVTIILANAQDRAW